MKNRPIFYLKNRCLFIPNDFLHQFLCRGPSGAVGGRRGPSGAVGGRRGPSGAVGGRRGPSVRKIIWWELGFSLCEGVWLVL